MSDYGHGHGQETEAAPQSLHLNHLRFFSWVFFFVCLWFFFFKRKENSVLGGAQEHKCGVRYIREERM